MSTFAYTDNFLKALSKYSQRHIEDKIASMGVRPGIMEERLDKWFTNFRNSEEKDIALKIFLEIDYFDEHRIENILSMYKTKLNQYLADRGKRLADIIVVTPDGNADSADSHAYKLSKEWQLSKDLVSNASEVEIERANNKCLVFFNDTHGSGNQFIKEFSSLIKGVGDSNCFILCYSLAKKAFDAFRKEFPNITIIPELPTPTIHEKNIFTPQQLQIIYLLGNKVYPPHPLGYGDCGLLVAYHFQCPNNNLPIVWANGENNSFMKSEGQKEEGYPWIPLFAYKSKTKVSAEVTFRKSDHLIQVKKIEEEFLQCRKDAIARSRRKSIAYLLAKLNGLPLRDFASLDLKARMLLQASREARSYIEFQNFSFEIGSIYEVIFEMQITRAEQYIAVKDFVNWAIDYSQLCGNSVGLNKIIVQLNTGIRRIGQFIGLNAAADRENASELLALRAKAKRALATLLRKRMASGQKAKNEISSLRKQALADAQNAYGLGDCASTKHELALCLFANTATMDSDNAIRGLELLRLAYKEGSHLAAYELARQLRMRHREEEAINVFKSVAEIDDDRRRFHSNVSVFASAVIGVYYKNKGEEKYMQDALLACQWLDEVISYEHHTAQEIVDYCQLKLICGFSKSDSFALLESLRPMSTMAWDQVADLARKVASGDDSICEALLLGLEDSPVWSRIGTLYSDFTTQFDKAIEFYDRAILIDKKCPIYHFNKARTLAFKLHDYELAHISLNVAKSLKLFSYAWYKENKEAFADLEAEIQKHVDG